MKPKCTGIWCVEVIFKQGGCEFVIFDDYADAQYFLEKVQNRHKFHRGMRVKDADIWEL